MIYPGHGNVSDGLLGMPARCFGCEWNGIIFEASWHDTFGIICPQCTASIFTSLSDDVLSREAISRARMRGNIDLLDAKLEEKGDATAR